MCRKATLRREPPRPKAISITNITPARGLSDFAQAERFQLLVDAVKDYAIYLLDADGNVASWNAGAQRFKGYKAHEIIGRHFSVFYTDHDRNDGLPARALATAAREGRFEAEGWRVRQDGTEFWTHVVIDPIREEGGGLIGFAKVTRDVTEKREAAAALERSRDALVQAQKMEAIGRLTGGVAHDFNNLLTVIRASADFLKRPGLSPEKRDRYVQAIADTAERATVLTSQLLAFARRQPLQPEIFDVRARLQGLRQIIGTTIGSGVAITLELPQEALLVEADASQFETAILNIVINARDAMPRGGAIVLSAVGVNGVPAVRGHAPAGGAFVAVSVADTGTGIAPDALARIFEPFFTTKPVDKGTGLGLSQVHGFAKQSRGDIDVASQVGVGTTFTLYLPQAAGQLPPQPEPSPNAFQSLPARRILLVEDNEGVGNFAAGLLAELGQAVTWVGDGRAALETLAQRAADFDLVFSDVVMPGISGIELGHQINARWPGLEVILTSGYSHILVEEGSHGFPLLKKPYSVQGLLTALRQGAGEG
jgi:PAS domain S-box-containing protein